MVGNCAWTLAHQGGAGRRWQVLARQLCSPCAGQDPPLHPSTCLYTKSGLSHREGSCLGQRDGVWFPRRWTNSNIWFSGASHGLFTEEIKARLFLAEDGTDSRGCMSAELSGQPIHRSHAKTSALLIVPFGKTVF